MYATLRKDGITSLDEALYAASCFAANAVDGSQTCTILTTIVGDEEHYRIEDGRVGPQRDNLTGWDWWPCYIMESVRQA